MIKEPMNFEKIKSNYFKRTNTNLENFFRDLDLIWSNCFSFNDDASDIYSKAREFQEYIKKFISKNFLNKINKNNLSKIQEDEKSDQKKIYPYDQSKVQESSERKVFSKDQKTFASSKIDCEKNHIKGRFFVSFKQHNSYKSVI